MVDYSDPEYMAMVQFDEAIDLLADLIYEGEVPVDFEAALNHLEQFDCELDDEWTHHALVWADYDVQKRLRREQLEDDQYRDMPYDNGGHPDNFGDR